MTTTSGGDVHLILFIHRVIDVPPGLYILLRSKSHLLEATLATIQGHIGYGNATWGEPPEITPAIFRNRLFALLENVDLRQLTADLACNQSTAADGHFSVAMLGDLASSVFFPPRPWRYPRLFWEAGAIAHSFYLSSYKKLATTGLGCFYDDLFHDVMGLEDHRFQALYFLAVGPPLFDERLLVGVDPYLLTRGQAPTFLLSSSMSDIENSIVLDEDKRNTYDDEKEELQTLQSFYNTPAAPHHHYHQNTTTIASQRSINNNESTPSADFDEEEDDEDIIILVSSSKATMDSSPSSSTTSSQ